MGYSIETYVGAYIVAKVKLTESDKVRMFCPAHPQAVFKLEDGYCNLCGSALSKAVTKRQSPPHLYDILHEDEYLDVLVQVEFPDATTEDHKNEIVLIGNRYYDDTPFCFDDDFDRVDITQDLVDTYVRNFIRQHTGIIDVLRNRVESLDIKFGVCRRLT